MGAFSYVNETFDSSKPHVHHLSCERAYPRITSHIQQFGGILITVDCRCKRFVRFSGGEFYFGSSIKCTHCTIKIPWVLIGFLPRTMDGGFFLWYQLVRKYTLGPAQTLQQRKMKIGFYSRSQMTIFPL